MYQLKVNNQFDFEIVPNEGNSLEVNGAAMTLDVVEMNQGKLHVLWNQKSFRAQVIAADYQEKTLTIRVNGTDYTIHAKDRYDLLLDQLGMSDLSTTKVNDIKAPMPGLVLDVSVSVGQEIAKGDAVLILEAMKMENILKAGGNGTVKAIKVKKGQTVEKNEVLVELE